ASWSAQTATAGSASLSCPEAVAHINDTVRSSPARFYDLAGCTLVAASTRRVGLGGAGQSGGLCSRLRMTQQPSQLPPPTPPTPTADAERPAMTLRPPPQQPPPPAASAAAPAVSGASRRKKLPVRYVPPRQQQLQPQQPASSTAGSSGAAEESLASARHEAALRSGHWQVVSVDDDLFACSHCPDIMAARPAEIRLHIVAEHLGVPSLACAYCTSGGAASCDPEPVLAHCRSAHPAPGAAVRGQRAAQGPLPAGPVPRRCPGEDDNDNEEDGEYREGGDDDDDNDDEDGGGGCRRSARRTNSTAQSNKSKKDWKTAASNPVMGSLTVSWSVSLFLNLISHNLADFRSFQLGCLVLAVWQLCLFYIGGRYSSSVYDKQQAQLDKDSHRTESGCVEAMPLVNQTRRRQPGLFNCRQIVLQRDFLAFVVTNFLQIFEASMWARISCPIFMEPLGPASPLQRSGALPADLSAPGFAKAITQILSCWASRLAVIGGLPPNPAVRPPSAVLLSLVCSKWRAGRCSTSPEFWPLSRTMFAVYSVACCSLNSAAFSLFDLPL
uniref:C2H2-type domain-containing protein n=1 Tax=Macrostomum lignano TaxID=282301 RepID=A0A1I8JLL1_9PLAT